MLNKVIGPGNKTKIHSLRDQGRTTRIDSGNEPWWWGHVVLIGYKMVQRTNSLWLVETWFCCCSSRIIKATADRASGLDARPVTIAWTSWGLRLTVVTLVGEADVFTGMLVVTTAPLDEALLIHDNSDCSFLTISFITQFELITRSTSGAFSKSYF